MGTEVHTDTAMNTDHRFIIFFIPENSLKYAGFPAHAASDTEARFEYNAARWFYC